MTDWLIDHHHHHHICNFNLFPMLCLTIRLHSHSAIYFSILFVFFKFHPLFDCSCTYQSIHCTAYCFLFVCLPCVVLFGLMATRLNKHYYYMYTWQSLRRRFYLRVYSYRGPTITGRHCRNVTPSTRNYCRWPSGAKLHKRRRDTTAPVIWYSRVVGGRCTTPNVDERWCSSFQRLYIGHARKRDICVAVTAEQLPAPLLLLLLLLLTAPQVLPLSGTCGWSKQTETRAHAPPFVWQKNAAFWGRIYIVCPCPGEKYAEMFLSYLLQNSDDSDKIWCVVGLCWINFPQSKVNVYASPG